MKTPAKDPNKNPYVGPHPLDRDQPLYGRDWELQELRDLLASRRIMLMHSPSGAGKTSLIQAGLIPALERGFAPEHPSEIGRAISRRVSKASAGSASQSTGREIVKGRFPSSVLFGGPSAR